MNCLDFDVNFMHSLFLFYIFETFIHEYCPCIFSISPTPPVPYPLPLSFLMPATLNIFPSYALCFKHLGVALMSSTLWTGKFYPQGISGLSPDVSLGAQ